MSSSRAQARRGQGLRPAAAAEDRQLRRGAVAPRAEDPRAQQHPAQVDGGAALEKQRRGYEKVSKSLQKGHEFSWFSSVSLRSSSDFPCFSINFHGFCLIPLLFMASSARGEPNSSKSLKEQLEELSPPRSKPSFVTSEGGFSSTSEEQAPRPRRTQSSMPAPRV